MVSTSLDSILGSARRLAARFKRHVYVVQMGEMFALAHREPSRGAFIEVLASGESFATSVAEK